MNIKLAAFDLDHTLIGSDLKVTPAVRVAIAQAEAAGVRVIIATGRDPLVTARYARELGLTTPIICYQGGVILDPLSGRELYSVRLPADLLPDIVRFAETHQHPLQFEESGTVYFINSYSHAKELLDLIANVTTVRIHGLSELPAVPHTFLLSVNTRKQRQPMRDAMQAHFGAQLTITPSHPLIVEGLPPGTSKGRALAWLAQHLGIAQENVLAMGDNDNDVSMLRWAAVGVTVRDGSPAARAAADWVAPPVSEDGVAAALYKFVL